MTDDVFEQALAELSDVVRCHCDEAYRDRDLQDPECNCDSMDAVRVVIARVEWLERERVLDAKLLADTQALLDKAEVVMREAADRIQQLGRERDAAIAAQHDAVRTARILAALEPAEMAGVETIKDALASLDMARDKLIAALAAFREGRK